MPQDLRGENFIKADDGIRDADEHLGYFKVRMFSIKG